MPQNQGKFDRCPFCRAKLTRVDEKTKRCPDPDGRGCGFSWRKNAGGLLYTVKEPAAEKMAREFFQIMTDDLV